MKYYKYPISMGIFSWFQRSKWNSRSTNYIFLPSNKLGINGMILIETFYCRLRTKVFYKEKHRFNKNNICEKYKGNRLSRSWLLGNGTEFTAIQSDSKKRIEELLRIDRQDRLIKVSFNEQLSKAEQYSPCKASFQELC